MLIVRPSQPADLAAIELIARQSPPGVTSLRAPRQLLAEHIDASCAALEELVTSPGDQRYLLVLQDSHSQQVIGVAGMVAAAGLVEPFYNYRRETLVHASRPLGIHHQVEVLSLCHDLTGHSLLHAFSILAPHLDLQSADLLCRARLLFAAAHPQRFAADWACELIGPCDQHARSPLWDSLGRHFFGLDYLQAEEYCAAKGRAFIAELLPQHPIYVSLLTPEAQAALGQSHPAAQWSRGILESEGFRVSRYVDIFDGGPVLQARFADLRTASGCHRVTARVVDKLASGMPQLLANAALGGFRATFAAAALDSEQAEAMIEADTARALQIGSGDSLLLVLEGGGDAGTFD
jgi:arginine N-succinyltransferase